jgi:threonylcarbamoyladenosine tRNA methylthiotransferase MtaB
VRVFFQTFGCKTNQYDTELLRTRMESGGGKAVDAAEGAELCVVNSCSVTAKADAECRQFVRHLVRVNPTARIVVTGCYATHAPAELRAISPRIEVYSNKEKDDLPACVGFEVKPEVFGLSRFSTRARAFVKIQDGCQAPCKYCIIPTTRPDYWSKPVEHVLKEVEGLVAEGHGEIVFTGIRLGLYRGKDAEGKPHGLTDLLRKIVRIPADFRVRLSSLEVTEVSDELIELAASTGKICRHFHIPLQSADDRVLKAMGRWYVYEKYAGRIALIKKLMPDAGLTADVLVGFPAETDEAFDTTFRRIEEMGLTGLHAFPFSRRPGTEAAEFSPLAPEVIKGRTHRLIGLSDRLKAAHRARHAGSSRMVLVEQPEAQGWTDNYIRVPVPADAPAGRLISILIP